MANGYDGHPVLDSAIDAAIAAGASFFGTLAGMDVAGIQSAPQAAIIASVVSAGLAFFMSLQAARARADRDRLLRPRRHK